MVVVVVVIVVIVVDVVVVVVVVVFVVVGLVFRGGVVIIVGHKNLTLKFGPNWVSNKSYIVVVVDQKTCSKSGHL